MIVSFYNLTLAFLKCIWEIKIVRLAKLKMCEGSKVKKQKANYTSEIKKKKKKRQANLRLITEGGTLYSGHWIKKKMVNILET